MQSITRILLIRFSSIGDIVLTTPVVRAIKEQMDGEVELHYLTKAAFASIVESNPHVDHVWTLQDDLDGLIDELKEQAYDYVIDLHKNIRSARVKHALKTLTLSVDKLNFKKLLLVSFGIDRMPDLHIVDRYMDACRPFGFEDDGRGLDFFIPEEEQVPAATIDQRLAQDYIVWVVGAAHPGKRFSVEKSIRILSRIEGPIALIGGASEKADAERISSAVGGGRVVDLCSQLTINGSANILSQATTVVSPDTGMMHIAAALGKRVVSIWGCTTPSLGMYPYRPAAGSVILEPEGHPKRPCSKLGDRCKYPVNCIEAIDEDALIEAVMKKG